MDKDSVHTVAASKVPMLKQGKYELWRIRMEQDTRMVHYSLWEVLDNGNAPPITKVVKGVETTIAPSTTKEKAQRRMLKRGLEGMLLPKRLKESSKAATVSTIVGLNLLLILVIFLLLAFGADAVEEIKEKHPQVVSAAKLPILNPNEFDLWKMRIKQYFLMTDYSLWEVILHGDSPIPTHIVEGVVQPVAPTTVEQKLTRKNELKAR
nr:hypothetical protein [Tanacetum cinerariifolium]